MKLEKIFKISGLLICFAVAFNLCLMGSAYPGETGKIVGRVIDSETGDPLPGANVTIQGTTMGASADADGYYVILKVRPGTYTVLPGDSLWEIAQRSGISVASLKRANSMKSARIYPGQKLQIPASE